MLRIALCVLLLSLAGCGPESPLPGFGLVEVRVVNRLPYPVEFSATANITPLGETRAFSSVPFTGLTVDAGRSFSVQAVTAYEGDIVFIRVEAMARALLSERGGVDTSLMAASTMTTQVATGNTLCLAVLLEVESGHTIDTRCD